MKRKERKRKKYLKEERRMKMMNLSKKNQKMKMRTETFLTRSCKKKWKIISEG